MAPKFGTSGLRGLITDLTPALVGDYLRAFLAACDPGRGLCIGWDLRPSSEGIARAAAGAARGAGVPVAICGAVPTPALAMAAMGQGMAALMVTGSHIPADRNGLKFYTPQGEITKADEAAILSALGRPAGQGTAPETAMADVAAAYAARYTGPFAGALAGLRIGLYAHSAVGRDLLAGVLRDCGAAVTELGRSDAFVPVDTEAVSAALRAQLVDWAGQGDFDAIVSTDADGDRPLLADGEGRVIPGDVLGQITGRWLGAGVAVTPVSSNSGAEQVFDQVIRTRIGSPFVIAAMEDAGGRVVGYEANGGFLLGFAARGLAPLMTRDALLPLCAVLAEAARAGGVAARVAAEPPVFTAADRLEEIPTARSAAFIASLEDAAQKRDDFLSSFDLVERATDRTDGLRMICDGAVMHLRPSGNAPELRLYVEADDPARAADLLARGLAVLRAKLG